MLFSSCSILPAHIPPGKDYHLSEFSQKVNHFLGAGPTGTAVAILPDLNLAPAIAIRASFEGDGLNGFAGPGTGHFHQTQR